MRFATMTIAAGYLLLAALPAMAADRIVTLRTALRHIPEGALATTDPMPIAFLDVKAMSRAEKGALSEGALRRLSLGSPIRPLDSLMYGMGKAWTEKAGVPFEDISYFVGYSQPPVRLSYWGLADSNAATALLDALGTRNFKEVEATPRMLANGEPRKISLTTRDPDNPWLGALGQSSFVIARDDAVVQSSAPEDFKQILGMKRSVADSPAITIALEGLAEASDMADADIVQATVITPLFGLAAIDPSDFLMDDLANLEVTSRKIKARMAENAKGIPPYLAGIIVDVQQQTGPALAVSLAYSDCATAENAILAIQSRWNEAMNLGHLRGMTGQAVPTDNMTCAAVVSFAANTAVNQPLLEAFGRYINRNFNFLQIGEPE